MSQKKQQSVYVTTTLPYVNADPHIGFAFEIVQADAFARLHRRVGFDVFFNTGSDEHGQKIWQKAQEAGKDAQQYVDEFSGKFDRLKSALNLSYNAFIRTTDPAHIKAAQAFWRRCDENGDIYKKEYRVKYCVGCELEKTDSELEGGRCPLHPDRELEIREEENYFFRFSRYEDMLLKMYEDHPNFVLPEKRFNEIKRFVEDGLNDFSISRLKSKMPWGVPVPGDQDHVMYVWFDALVNYISTLGWPDETDQYRNFWEGGYTVQFAGKDQVRQQAAMWQAMLLSAGLPTTHQIFLHGFINVGGAKMSKSVGNVIDPYDLVGKFGTDAVRYYLLRHIHPFEDSDYTDEKFTEAYNAHLANGLGNLVSRIMTMLVKYDVEVAVEKPDVVWEDDEWDELQTAVAEFRFHDALDYLWAEISQLDAFIADRQPYKKIVADPDEAKEDVAYLAIRLYDLAVVLKPFMPETAQRIQAIIKNRTAPDEPIFPRMDDERR